MLCDVIATTTECKALLEWRLVQAMSSRSFLCIPIIFLFACLFLFSTFVENDKNYAFYWLRDERLVKAV